jgi:exopolysaccharide biosynthesis polyprenyl glycosylphosphotransferase
MFDLHGSTAIRARSRPALRRFLPWSVAALDALLIYGAFVVAYWARYSLKLGPHIQDQVPFGKYQPLALLVLGIMMSILLIKGAYRSRLSTEIVDELATIFSSATITVATIVVITAMLHQFEYSRGVIVYLWVLVVALVAVGRAGHRSLQGVFHRKGVGVRRLLVVGASNVSKMIMQSVMSRPDLGYELVGFVAPRGSPLVRDFGRFRALGTVADLPELIDAGNVDDIILALPASAHEEVWPILNLCEQHGVGLKLVPDLFEMSLGRVQVDDIAGIPLLDVQEKPLRRFARAAKRGLDLAIALIVLIVSLPFMALLAALIRIESPGSPVFRQTRIGLEGRSFTCLKLRTMHEEAMERAQELIALNEADGPLFKMRIDPRCTRMGRLIRRWSLDELPQIWNVLIGDMSLVGPRPPLPQEVAQYEEWHMRRLEVKPGMTGIWQVSGRSHLSFEEMVVMDIYYVDNWSLALDVKILLRTIRTVLARHGAF